MVLPLMMAGAGILGGANFLMGKYNERKAADSYEALERDIQKSSFAGTADGQSMLNHAQSKLDDAGFMEWGSGEPNQFLDSMRDGLFQHGLQSSAQQQAAELAAFNSAPGQAQARGDALSEQFHAMNKADIDAQYATQGLLDVLYLGDSASYAQSMLMWAQSMGMGALQGPDQRIVEGVGGTPGWFARAFNGLIDGKTWDKEAAMEIANSVKTAWNPRYERLQRSKKTFAEMAANANRRYQALNADANTGNIFRYGSGPMSDEFNWQGEGSQLPPLTAAGTTPAENLKRTTRALGSDIKDSATTTFQSIKDAAAYYGFDYIPGEDEQSGRE